MDEMLRLSNDAIDIGIPPWCGPRVLHCARPGDTNLFGDAALSFTDTALGRWRPIGGHRLWVAPERMPGSYAPDDRPVTLELRGPASVCVRAETDAAGMEKALEVTLVPQAPVAVVRHLITNRTCWPTQVAPWAITVVNPAATVLLPQPPCRTHAEQFLPSRAMVQWAYTDFTDPRLTLGRRLIRLTPDPAVIAAQKIGLANSDGWSAAVLDAVAFIKWSAWQGAGQYPDLGCHTEVFTAGGYLELETLGALTLLEPGHVAVHTEVWAIASVPDLRADEGALSHELARTVQATLELPAVVAALQRPA